MTNVPYRTLKSISHARATQLVLLAPLLCFHSPVSAQSHPPRLSCSVDSQQPEQNGIVEVSKLAQIGISVGLSSVDVPVAPMTLRIDSGSAKMGNTEIIVREVGSSDASAVSVLLSLTGTQRDSRGMSISVLAQIPVDETKRRKDIETYLSWVETDAASAENTSTRTLAAFRSNRAAIAKAFEQMYLENRTGTYELLCKYSSHLSGYWQGDLQARSSMFKVKNDGKFFEQPAFKHLQAPLKH